MDDARARELLTDEKQRILGLLAELTTAARDDRDAANEPGDMSDPAGPLTSEGTDDAIAAGLRARLEAIERAEARLRAGTYGRSVVSGVALPDARLEADPAAEVTVEEAAQQQA